MTSGRRLRAMVGGALAGLGLAAGAAAEPSRPVEEPAAQTAPSPEQEYNRGLRARASRDWRQAEEAQRRALALRARFPEAWSELGYALRNQGRFEEAVRAYDEALRLRPDFAEALEYLGEAYVKMGRLDDARKVLDRLQPLNAGLARGLAETLRRAR